PFQEASNQAMKQFKVDLQKYEAQLTPAQLQQQVMEKRQKMAKRKAIRKKRVRRSCFLGQIEICLDCRVSGKRLEKSEI
ncbi:hypothetical protein GOODEAATRI_028162, partial [Goodea atripinnis]